MMEEDFGNMVGNKVGKSLRKAGKSSESQYSAVMGKGEKVG